MGFKIPVLRKINRPFSPKRTEHKWSDRSMTSEKWIELSRRLSQCGKLRHSNLGSALHAVMIKSINVSYKTLAVWNSLLSFYSKCGQLNNSLKLFDQMPLRDSISWNSLLHGCSLKRDYSLAFEYFNKMREFSNCPFDSATITTVLSCCEQTELISQCEMIHCFEFKQGFDSLVPVGNAMITAYFECGSSVSARKVFDEMPERNLITWTAMVSGLAQNELYKESLISFYNMRYFVNANYMTYSSALTACSKSLELKLGKQIHGLILKSGFGNYLIIQSALMDLYSKCNLMQDSLQIFDSCEQIDEVSSTVILVGLAQNGLEQKAFEFFSKLVKLRVRIDTSMVSAILGAFGSHAPLKFGKQIHSMVIKNNFVLNVYICNGLINMYSKCGEIYEAFELFGHMENNKNLVSWNSIILAFARNGDASKVFEIYECMKNEGIKPNDVTFLALLHACSHARLKEMGFEILDSMVQKFEIEPRVEHHACIIDILGRAGDLNEAKEYIHKLNVESKVLLWETLLGACSIHGDINIAKYAAERLIHEAPMSKSGFVFLNNLYSSENKWIEKDIIMKKMSEIGVKKDMGMSWIDD